MLNNYICALDVSSSKISAVVAEIKKRRIKNIFFEYQPSKGIRKGSIIDSIELTTSISQALKKLRNRSKIKIKSVYANISGQDIVTRHSYAIIPLAERGSRVITSYDIQHVNEQARILGSNLEEEIIHQLPFSYTVDSNENILNPLGLYSHKLAVDLYLICARLSFVQTLTRVINQAGYEIINLFFSGLTTSSVVFDKAESNATNIFCDIGSDNTELLIFRNGILRDIRILSVGADQVTAQLCDTFKISFDLAQEIKHSYAVIGDCSQISQGKEVLLKKDGIYKPIKQKEISEVVTSKARSICETIKKVLDEAISGEKVDNFVVAGRAVLQEGFIEMLEATLGVSLKIARIKNPDLARLISRDPALSGQKYLTYITCLGMISQALEFQQLKGIFSLTSPHNPFLKIISKAKEVYQEYF